MAKALDGTPSIATAIYNVVDSLPILHLDTVSGEEFVCTLANGVGR